MSWLGQIARGVGTALLTGSAAGAVTAFASNSMLAGLGVGTLDNITGRSLSYGMGNVWNGNYGYGGFYNPGCNMWNPTCAEMMVNPWNGNYVGY